MTETIRHKRGDTLLWGGVVSEDGVAVDLTDYEIRSQIRRKNELIAELDVTYPDRGAGEFLLTASAEDTAAWPTVRLEMDIELTDPDGYVLSSETVHIDCLKDITAETETEE